MRLTRVVKCFSFSIMALFVMSCVDSKDVPTLSNDETVAPSTISGSYKASKPNVLLIVVDDAAYSDFGAYGGEIDTPTIDSLAENGVMFSQFHVTPNCSSTRGSLLTGMDPHRTGMGTHAVGTENQQGKPGYEGYLNHKVATVAEVMQGAGYRTLMAGKWHLASRDKATWPISRGFDKTFVLLNGGASHWQDNLPLFPSKPSMYTANGTLLKSLPEGFYSTTTYTDKMIEFIDEEKTSGKPFFAYLAYTAPHNPLHAPEELIKKYESRYADGWDKLQQTRLQGLKEKGLIAADVNIQQRPEFIAAWEALSADEKNQATRDMAVYAGMVDAVDQNIGRLVGHLKQQGVYDNTLIIFMSDNGPSKTTIANYLALDGAGEEFIKSFKNELNNRGLPGSSVDLGPGWAYGLAAPFRMMKGYQSEGGILSPLIVKLPSSYQANTSRVHAVTHVMDIMPTIMDFADASHPANESTSPLHSMQGASLLPLLTGVSDDKWQQRGIGGELFGMRYFRQGDWKALYMPEPYGSGGWQLYNIANDPAESRDISAEFPGKLSALVLGWQEYAKINGVVEPNRPIAYAVPPKGNSGKDNSLSGAR
jgi:arylsulfatase A-like enzyme